MSDIQNNIPEIVEARELSVVEKKIAKIKDRMVDLLEDSLDVLHTAIKGDKWKDTGKVVTRTQLYAATPIVAKFAPEIEKSSTGAIHFHMNVPRPKPQPIENVTVIETAPIKPVGPAAPITIKDIAPKVKRPVSKTSSSDSHSKP